MTGVTEAVAGEITHVPLVEEGAAEHLVAVTEDRVAVEEPLEEEGFGESLLRWMKRRGVLPRQVSIPLFGV